MRLEDRRDQRLEIALELGEVVDVALARIAQRPVRAALAPPVERGDRKPALEQVAGHLEIFLDELAPSPEQRHRAPRRVGRRPADGAQPDAVGRMDVFLDRAGRRGILACRRQGHPSPRSVTGPPA